MAYRKRGFGDHYEPHEMIDIGGFPAPKADRKHRFYALASVLRLLANKEDTRQVFEIISSLSGDSFQNLFGRFVGTEYGRRVVSQPIELENILTRSKWLASLPKGSVGRAYLGFMERENLTPEGILQAAKDAGIDYDCKTQFEALRRVSLHLEVVHDLWHVLTGYDRDALGELCLLAFTHAMTFNEGFRWITTVGGVAAKLEAPGQPIWGAIREGGAIGRSAAWLPGVDIEALMATPLDEARKRLTIRMPRTYLSISKDVRAGLLKPKLTKTQSEREAGETRPQAA